LTQDGQWTVAWPSFSEELAREDEVEIVVQVGGRRARQAEGAGRNRGRRDRQRAQVEPGIGHHLAGKRIVKRIFVPDKLLNLVVA